MEAINNDTFRAILQLIGPAGVGLLFYSAATTYALYMMFNQLNNTREEARKDMAEKNAEIKDISERQITVQLELKNVMERLLERVK